MGVALPLAMGMPSLRFLRTFHIAARRGSFKAAADELCVTASAVSHQIKLLETQLGTPLFARGPRSLSLTEAGALYLENIDALFVQLECVTQQLRERFNRLVVRLQVPSFFASELLLPRLASFSALRSEVDLRLATDIAPNDLHSSDADVSIVIGQGPWPGLQSTRLFNQTYVAACSPQLQALAGLRSPLDLEHAALIAHEHRPELWQRWAALQGMPPLRPKQLIRVDTMSAVVHAAEQGVGVALVSAPLAAARFSAGTLVRLFDTELETGDSYFLVTRPADAERAPIAALLEWLQQQFGARTSA
jgi:LysR family transcriptional regulator, glycine cleavage system transcriptional activator